MKFTTSNKLDPTLRRLVNSSNDNVRLRNDLGRGFVSSRVPVSEAESEVEPDILSKRVLFSVTCIYPPEKRIKTTDFIG